MQQLLPWVDHEMQGLSAHLEVGKGHRLILWLKMKSERPFPDSSE